MCFTNVHTFITFYDTINLPGLIFAENQTDLHLGESVEMRTFAPLVIYFNHFYFSFFMCEQDL